MTASGAGRLVSTGHRMLWLERHLRRTPGLNGILATYQGMLTNPHSRLASILDSLAPSSLYGSGRVAHLLGRSSDETPMSDHWRWQSNASPDAASSVIAKSSYETIPDSMGATAPAPTEWLNLEAMTALPRLEEVVQLPEAYLLSARLARQRPERGRVGATAASDHVSESATPRTRPVRVASEVLKSGLRFLSGPTPSRGIRYIPSLVDPEIQRPSGRPDALDGKSVSPEIDIQRLTHWSNEPEKGNVRLSRGGAGLLSILRHNLAPEPAPAELPLTTPHQNSEAPMAERFAGQYTSDPQPISEGAEHSFLPGDYGLDSWNMGQVPQELSQLQLDQVLDTLAERLELVLLRTYGTSRR
jgi:hypothetical protein